MRVLISGFDPFGKDTINPSMEAVKLLPDTLGDIEIIKVELPTIAYTCVDKMISYVKQYEPDVVINVGQAGGRKNISIERVAININDFRIADNANQVYVDEAIYEDGENAYFSTLPIKYMYETLRKADISVEISNSAGTFVCNHIMYAMRYHGEKNHCLYKSGFVHIPYLPQQVEDEQYPSMPLDEIVHALKEIIKASIKDEIKKGAGKEW